MATAVACVVIIFYHRVNILLKNLVLIRLVSDTLQLSSIAVRLDCIIIGLLHYSLPNTQLLRIVSRREVQQLSSLVGHMKSTTDVDMHNGHNKVNSITC